MEKVAEYLRNTITDKMTVKDIVDIFENVCQPMNEIVKEYYDDKIINRAKNVLLYQKHKYQYMFYNIL